MTSTIIHHLHQPTRSRGTASSCDRRLANLHRGELASCLVPCIPPSRPQWAGCVETAISTVRRHVFPAFVISTAGVSTSSNQHVSSYRPALTASDSCPTKRRFPTDETLTLKSSHQPGLSGEAFAPITSSVLHTCTVHFVP